MTLQECYIALGGDFDDVLQRFRKESLVTKFIFKFLDDQSYSLLCQSMKDNNIEEAFRAAHTLKGICQNLSFTKLYKASCDMTEALRHGKAPNADEVFIEFKQVYQCCYDAIASYKQEIGGEMHA